MVKFVFSLLKLKDWLKITFLIFLISNIGYKKFHFLSKFTCVFIFEPLSLTPLMNAGGD